MVPLQSNAIPLVVSYVLLTSLSAIAVILRFVSIRILNRQVKAHDILCLVSLVFLIAYAIDTLVGTIYGDIGLHIDRVPLPHVRIALITFFASQFFWAASIVSFRLSILHLYIEIFSAKLFRRCAYGSGCLVGLFYIGSMTATLRICEPIRFNWDKTIIGTCGNEGTAELAAAAINMVLDVLIVLLPLPVVWKLQMPTQKKIGVTVTFALGLSIAGINLGRIIKVLDCDLSDFTYCTLDSAILTVAEMAVGIIVACIPTLRPVFSPHRYGSSAQKTYNSSLSTGIRARLHGYHKDTSTSGKPSFQGFGGEEIEMCDGLGAGASKSYVTAAANANRTPNPADVASDVIGVRKDYEVTRGCQGREGNELESTNMH